MFRHIIKYKIPLKWHIVACFGILANTRFFSNGILWHVSAYYKIQDYIQMAYCGMFRHISKYKIPLKWHIVACFGILANTRFFSNGILWHVSAYYKIQDYIQMAYCGMFRHISKYKILFKWHIVACFGILARLLSSSSDARLVAPMFLCLPKRFALKCCRQPFVFQSHNSNSCQTIKLQKWIYWDVNIRGEVLGE